MTEAAPFVHPYIPNSAPATREAMLRAVGASSTEELLEAIPEKLRLRRSLDVPAAFRSEFELDRHLQKVLAKNEPASDAPSFLGSGCYPHYVPAICDEINTRGEFLTAYAGETYEDHGKWQALYEYTSLMADLLEMDVVNVPTYDGYQALATSLRMAVRITGRPRVVIPDTIERGKRERVEGFLEGVAEVVTVASDAQTGAIDEAALAEAVDDTVAAVLIESPNYLGVVEAGAERIAFADEVLGPLDRHDPDRKMRLVDALRLYLRLAGSMEDVFGQLGMHRHTLRTRLALISELTGRSLVEPDDRFELWLAVEMRDLTEAGE
ncbi:helix-turn-helix domain-containing protein [Agrococcus casei]|uniref:helix-turn-helix domain-containing protein n=2 Tax=Agrococcus casei TaxID=343512 RepID=UPI003F932B5B